MQKDVREAAASLITRAEIDLADSVVPIGYHAGFRFMKICQCHSDCMYSWWNMGPGGIGCLLRNVCWNSQQSEERLARLRHLNF